MATKKKILLLSDWYLPAYKAGGPIRSVAGLAYHLKDDFDIYVLTSNTDVLDDTPLPVKTNEWVNGNNGEKIFYLPGKITRARLLEVMNSVDYDYVYINSFFSKAFSIYPLLLQKSGKIKKPIVLAPRGMLREGALAIKAGKKKVFIALSKIGSLHKNITWHATSEPEVNEIRKVYGENTNIFLAANLTLPPQQKRNSYDKRPGELRICSVTRLVRNKQIDFAINVLKQIKTGKILFDVYGPPEDEAYYKECLELAKTVPPNIEINFKGNILPHEVEGVLKEYHVFLLPTETENFGHAIVEAMLNGCIPLISDRTPWRNLEKSGIGWDLPLGDQEAFLNALQKCLEMDQTAFKTQSISIQSFADDKTSDLNTLEAYKQVFK